MNKSPSFKFISNVTQMLSFLSDDEMLFYNENPLTLEKKLRSVFEDKEGITLTDITELPPVSFLKNKNGHYEFTIVGSGRTGEQEMKYLKDLNIGVSRDGTRIMIAGGLYNINHRLEKGKKYRVALVPNGDIMESSAGITRYVQRFDYRVPPVEVMFRVREVFGQLVGVFRTNREEIGYIVCPHKPIKDGAGRSWVFFSQIFDALNYPTVGGFIDAEEDNGIHRWTADTAFVFLAS